MNNVKIATGAKGQRSLCSTGEFIALNSRPRSVPRGKKLKSTANIEKGARNSRIKVCHNLDDDEFLGSGHHKEDWSPQSGGRSDALHQTQWSSSLANQIKRHVPSNSRICRTKLIDLRNVDPKTRLDLEHSAYLLKEEDDEEDVTTD